MTLILVKTPKEALFHNGVTDEKHHCYFTKQIVLAEEVKDEHSTENKVFECDKDIDKVNLSYRYKPGTYILPNDFGIGKLVISDSFASCQIILAKLSTGEFALFHSVSHLADDAFDVFYKEIKNKVEFFYFFSPTHHQNGDAGLFRANALYLDLVAKAGGPHKVVHYVVPRYHGIVADAERNQIIVSRLDFEFKPLEQIKNLLESNTTSADITPITKTKTLAEAKSEMMNHVRIFPEACTGDNKYIREIKKSIKQKVELPKFEFKMPTDEEQKPTPTPSLLDTVTMIVNKLSKKVSQSRVLKYFGAADAQAKAQQILKSLAVAKANYSILTFNNLSQFFSYAEGREPSLEKALRDGNVYKLMVDELNKFASLSIRERRYQSIT